MVLQSAVLSFSDQQIVTGFAILTSGYILLGRSNLSVYHWQIEVDLAWLSSITHLTTLTSLRAYFRKSRRLAHIRTTCMVVVAIMLACAMGSVGYVESSNRLSICLTAPASFLFSAKAMHGYYNNKPYIIIVLAILSCGYGLRIFQLFMDLKEVKVPLYSIVRRNHSELQEWANDRTLRENRTRVLWILFLRAITSNHYVFRAAIDLYQSVLWEV